MKIDIEELKKILIFKNHPLLKDAILFDFKTNLYD